MLSYVQEFGILSTRGTHLLPFQRASCIFVSPAQTSGPLLVALYSTVYIVLR